MTILQAIVLGVVQGIGEFLPISSSAHLVLVPWLFGWRDPGLSFDVALHAGTLLAVLAFFWRDWLTLIRHGLRGIGTPEGRVFWSLAAASIPGGLTGLCLEKQAETSFRAPWLIAVMLIIVGILLYAADRFGPKQIEESNIGFGRALWIGLAQAVAIVPGVSRSGATMAAGRCLGLTRENAARFSFLLATPIMAGAGLYKLRHLAAKDISAPFAVGVIVSALVGLAAIRLLLGWLRRGSFAPFAWYRLCAGTAVLILFLLRVR